MAIPDYWRLYSECVGKPSKPFSCDEFFRLISDRFRSIAFHIADQYRCNNECDDIVQQIRLKLVSDKSILNSLPRQPQLAYAYLSKVAANAARDFVRRAGAERRDHRRTVSLDDTPLAATARNLTIEREILLQEIRNSLPANPLDRTIFELYFRQGFTAEEIAAIPAVRLTPKGVESRILRTTKKVQDALRQNRAANIEGKVSASASKSGDIK